MQTNNRNVVIAVVSLVVIVLIAAFLLLRGSGSGSGGLTGTQWQLASIRQTTPAYQGVVPAADQPRYTITFDTDGTYNGTADCNRISGSYTTSGSNGITINAGISTLAMCPEDSFGPLFAHGLTTATTWSVANGQLTLSRADGASVASSPASPARRRPLRRPRRRRLRRSASQSGKPQGKPDKPEGKPPGDGGPGR